MVYMFLANGFEEIEALYTLDLLRRASVDVLTVGISGKTAEGSHGIPVICDITADELPFNEDFDMIILAEQATRGDESQYDPHPNKP